MARSPDDWPTAKNPRGPALATSQLCTLVVVEGPDQARELVCDDAQPMLVGQSSACALRLTDRAVSRRHASVDVSGGVWRIRDLDSTNGTWVDDVRVADAYLSPGSRVYVGSTTIAVRASPNARSADAPSRSSFGRVVGTSEEMRRLYPLFETLAKSRVHLLVEGASGTGKELLAECLHELGPTPAAPFVVVVCSDVLRAVADAEIFGDATHAGALELAHGGTLVFDEISDLDSALQHKLLYAVERREATRVGTTTRYPCDVRVIVTTRRDPDREVDAGHLREDLLQVLSVARVELPPLGRRRGDVEALAAYFARELGVTDVPREVLDRWRDNSWPGNVRELKRTVLQRLTLGDLGSQVDRGATASSGATDIEGFATDAIARDRTFTEAREELLGVFERVFVERALAKHGGNVLRAASAVGLARRYFQILRARHARRPGR